MGVRQHLAMVALVLTPLGCAVLPIKPPPQQKTAPPVQQGTPLEQRLAEASAIEEALQRHAHTVNGMDIQTAVQRFCQQPFLGDKSPLPSPNAPSAREEKIRMAQQYRLARLEEKNCPRR